MSLHGGQAASNAGIQSYQGLNLAPTPGFDFMQGIKDFGGFLGSDAGGGLLKLGSLGLGAFGLNKALGLQEDQLGILKDQEARAAGAQKFQTGNSLALQLATTTPGTPEHERVKQLIAEGNFNTA